MDHLPPRTNLPILQKLVATYIVWQSYPRNFPKDLRYTLGSKIDNFFIEVIELISVASRINVKQKLPYLIKASIKLDTLKFFLQVAWGSKALDNKKYITISERLDEVGKMLGGWQKDVVRKTNPA